VIAPKHTLLPTVCVALEPVHVLTNYASINKILPIQSRSWKGVGKCTLSAWVFVHPAALQSLLLIACVQVSGFRFQV